MAQSNDNTTTTVTRKSRRAVAGKRSIPPAPTGTVMTDADVARRAYLIYLEEGCPQGRHLDHWLRAETELRTQV
jgi:hypothetical protein